MYTVSYRDMTGNIIKDKKFNTRQEMEEDYQESIDRYKILLNDTWYLIRYNRKVGSEYIVGVTLID